MQSGRGRSGAADQKQNPVLMIALVVVILAAVFFVYKTMSSSGGGVPPPDTSTATAPPTLSRPPMHGGPPSAMPPPGGKPPGVSVPHPGVPAPPTAPPSPGAAPAAKRAARPVQARPAAKPALQPQMRQIKVFSTITISYPADWKISAGGGNTAAVFTDGKAFFEVRPPDPRATSAKAIAQSALKSLAKGAAPTAQGSDRIAGYDTYWVAVTVGGQMARIIGVDAPTRVVVFEHVRGGQFSSYRDLFNKMQAGMTFGG